MGRPVGSGGACLLPAIRPAPCTVIAQIARRHVGRIGGGSKLMGEFWQSSAGAPGDGGTACPKAAQPAAPRLGRGSEEARNKEEPSQGATSDSRRLAHQAI